MIQRDLMVKFLPKIENLVKEECTNPGQHKKVLIKVNFFRMFNLSTKYTVDRCVLTYDFIRQVP